MAKQVDVATPGRNLPALMPLNVDLQEGYFFGDQRWEGLEFKKNAYAVAKHFDLMGHPSGVHAGNLDRWEKGKQQKTPYYKVWIKHAENEDLYTWWQPTTMEWNYPLSFEFATWFEFIYNDKK